MFTCMTQDICSSSLVLLEPKAASENLRTRRGKQTTVMGRTLKMKASATNHRFFHQTQLITLASFRRKREKDDEEVGGDW